MFRYVDADVERVWTAEDWQGWQCAKRNVSGDEFEWLPASSFSD
jgi:hypothetical protein